MDPKDLSNWKAVISEYEHRGDLFKAYDAALESLEFFPDELWLKHRAVLSLANAGATLQAEKKFFEFRLDENGETEGLTLHGRILKQKAFQAPPAKQSSIIREAISRYDMIFLAPAAPRPAVQPDIEASIPDPLPNRPLGY